MYLSAFNLDRRSNSVRQCLANSHDMHRTIMSGFGQFEGKNPRETAGVLYKLDTTGRDIKLYVSSIEEPIWDYIENMGFIKIGVKNITEVKESLLKGRIYSFNLLAYPSKKETREGKISHRLPLKTTEERIEWLNRKAEQNGFEVQWAREDENINVYVKQSKNGVSTIHSGVRFRGVLYVQNEELFQKAFKEGVGAGKSYGFGMLILFAVGGAL